MLLNETGYVKLADFGFAKKLGRDSRTRTFCGTPGNQLKISIENAKKSFWHRLLILRFSNLAIICLKIMTRVPWITNFQNYILISPFRKFYQYISPVKGESDIFQTCSKDMPESRFEPVIHGPWTLKLLSFIKF